MAQTSTIIKKQMTDAFIGSPIIASLYGLTPGLSFEAQFSAVSLESILFDIFAFFLFTLQVLFDAHRDEIVGIIKNTKPHKVPWYATMARLYRHGYNLVTDEDYYSDAGLTAAQITASQVVAYAAATEIAKGIRIKVAGIASGDLAPLGTTQLNGLKTYMGRVKDGGVRLYITSSVGDSLRLNLAVYYDALILDNAGARLDGTASTPVSDAINAFLKSQPFDGLFVLAHLEDALQAVDGVVIPEIITAEARYGALPYQAVPVEYLPDGGYMRITTGDLTITYIPHEPV